MNQEMSKESAGGDRKGVKISREFDFPRESVFGMFIDPQKAAKFWGPEGATSLLFEVDPTPGGVIRIHDRHHGATYRTTGTIVEIVVPERLVFRASTSSGEGAAPWEALQTITFEELGPRRTRVNVRVKVLAAGVFPGGAASLEEGFQVGWGQTFDRLQRELR